MYHILGSKLMLEPTAEISIFHISAIFYTTKLESSVICGESMEINAPLCRCQVKYSNSKWSWQRGIYGEFEHAYLSQVVA